MDALQESVNRRLNSVNNAENYTRETAYATIEMPERSAIFQTSVRGKIFSTPSRDMRLLISLDTVVNFPDKVARGSRALRSRNAGGSETAGRGIATGSGHGIEETDV